MDWAPASIAIIFPHRSFTFQSGHLVPERPDTLYHCHENKRRHFLPPLPIFHHLTVRWQRRIDGIRHWFQNPLDGMETGKKKNQEKGKLFTYQQWWLDLLRSFVSLSVKSLHQTQFPHNLLLFLRHRPFIVVCRRAAVCVCIVCVVGMSHCVSHEAKANKKKIEEKIIENAFLKNHRSNTSSRFTWKKAADRSRLPSRRRRRRPPTVLLNNVSLLSDITVRRLTNPSISSAPKCWIHSKINVQHKDKKKSRTAVFIRWKGYIITVDDGRGCHLRRIEKPNELMAAAAVVR